MSFEKVLVRQVVWPRKVRTIAVRLNAINYISHMASGDPFKPCMVKTGTDPQGNVFSSQPGPHNLRHPVSASSLGHLRLSISLDLEGGGANHDQPWGILNTMGFNTSLISCWIWDTWYTSLMTWETSILFQLDRKHQNECKHTALGLQKND